MYRPSRKERHALRRLRQPQFEIRFDSGEILRQLDRRADAQRQIRR
jgi:hypothetical protein